MGERFVANLVNALSTFVPACTEPAKSNELVAEFHSRFAFAAELLTSEVNFPALEYFAIIPSRTPAIFFPASVSVLLPIAYTLESVPSTTASILVSTAPK